MQDTWIIRLGIRTTTTPYGRPEISSPPRHVTMCSNKHRWSVNINIALLVVRMEDVNSSYPLLGCPWMKKVKIRPKVGSAISKNSVQEEKDPDSS